MLSPALISAETMLSVPASVAVCPYCQTRLTVGTEAWTQVDDGSWVADSISMRCETEPGMDDEGDERAYRDWLRTHSEMPYVFLLPVETRVLDWVNRNARFRGD